MLDGTTGLNMLPQAREFNDVIFPIPVHLNWKCYLNIFYTLCFLKGCLHTSSTRNENMVLNPEIPLSRWHIISLLKSNICFPTSTALKIVPALFGLMFKPRSLE